MLKPLSLKKDKRGIIAVIIFFLILFTILIVGFIAVMVLGVVDYASDTITPIMNDLGMAGDSTNMSEYSTYTFDKVNTIVQALPMLAAFAYVGALIFTLVFVFSLSQNPHPVFIGFYFMMMLLLIFGCMFMSNMYQDIYQGTDEIATRVQDQTIMSYLILYSPFIMALIAVIAGIVLFSRVGPGGAEVICTSNSLNSTPSQHYS